MERIQFIKSIRAIAEAKKNQLQILRNKGEEGSIEYSILRVEMEDALQIVEANKEGNDELHYVIDCVTGFTTSNSILDMCRKFLGKG